MKLILPLLKHFLKKQVNSPKRNTPGLTRDLFLGGKVILWQSVKGYRAGIDAVLLATSIKLKESQKILDLGCGAGAISLCVLANHPNVLVTGLEIMEDTVDVAKLNAEENNFELNFRPMLGSIADMPPTIEKNSFDLVLSNPPYAVNGTTNFSSNIQRKIAHVETHTTIEMWIEVAAAALKHRGTISLIHRADRLDHLLSALRPYFGEIIIHPLWPKSGRKANRILIKAKKGSEAPTILTAGTIIHMDNGSYTPEIESILRGRSLLTIE